MKCPVGETNRLRDSITSYVQGNEGIIGTNLFYAPYVEFGTGSFAKNGDGRAGYWVYVKNSPHKEQSSYRKIYNYQTACWIADRLREQGLEPVITKGQLPQPYLQPALLESKEKIINAIKNSIEEQIK